MPDDNTDKDKAYLDTIGLQLQVAPDETALFHAIVNAPFTDLVQSTSYDLGIIVFLLANTKTGTIDRIALSDTPQAHGAVKMSEKPFNAIKIPLEHKGNIIADAIRTNKPHFTGDWQYLFTPAMSMQAARFNQAGAGIECSYVYPLIGCRDGGALIFSYYQPPDNIKARHKHFMEAYSGLVATQLNRA